jgi:dipeptidyl aminopeptidase/acylaminoacyl peptidase
VARRELTPAVVAGAAALILVLGGGDAVASRQRPCSAATAELGRIAYVRSGSLHVLDLATCEDRVLAKPASSPVRFSPDGRWTAFGSGAVVSARGGQVRRARTTYAWAWAPRGHVLAAVTPRGGLLLGSRRLLPDGWGTSDVAFAPDGSIVVARSRRTRGSIWTLARPSRTPNQVIAFSSGPPELAAVSRIWVAYWVRPDGSNSIAADGLPLEAKYFVSGARGSRLADATLLWPDDVSKCGRGLVFTAGADRYASNDKRLLAATPSTTDRGWTIRGVSRDRKRSWVAPSCSPDARWVAAAAGPHRVGRFGREARSIWRLATRGSSRRQLTRPPAGKSDESPRWSRNGRSIVFVRSGPTRGDATAAGSIYVVASAGGPAVGPFARVGPTGNYYGHYAWSDVLDYAP